MPSHSNALPRHIRFQTAVAALTLLTSLSILAGAGPLNPPSGAVAPTAKPLAEVEPRTAISSTNTPGDGDSLFKITAPGSYYLTGNITGTSGKMGIEIAASGVTIDLNGFELLGVAGTLDGVGATLSSLNNIAIRNGSVRNWSGDGVDLGSTGVLGATITAVRANGNGGNGIAAGSGATVTSCTASSNTSGGITVGSDSHASHCSATVNTGTGIAAAFGSSITDCSASNNAGSGISVGAGCAINACSTVSNGAAGITTATGCAVTGCAANNNTTNGINTSTACTITDCSISGSGTAGINATLGTTIRGCTVRTSALDGIIVSSGCRISSNLCANNGNLGDGANIHATSVDNVIDANTCINADRGIDVDAAGNFITRNTCSGNTTNWDVVANNICLVVQGATAAAILGNTGGVAPGSTDPNANFTY